VNINNDEPVYRRDQFGTRERAGQLQRENDVEHVLIQDPGQQIWTGSTASSRSMARSARAIRARRDGFSSATARRNIATR